MESIPQATNGDLLLSEVWLRWVHVVNESISHDSCRLSLLIALEISGPSSLNESLSLEFAGNLAEKGGRAILCTSAGIRENTWLPSGRIPLRDIPDISRLNRKSLVEQRRDTSCPGCEDIEDLDISLSNIHLSNEG